MPAKLIVTWTGNAPVLPEGTFGTVAVERDGVTHAVPGPYAWYFVAGLNYSGDVGSWCKLTLYESDSKLVIRAEHVEGHLAGEDVTITDYVSDDQGVTWKSSAPLANLDGTVVDTYETQPLFLKELVAQASR